MRFLKYFLLTLALLLLGPLYMAAYGSDEAGTSASRGWQFAKRDSSRIAPLPADFAGAVIEVYAARTYSWRGHLAVHTWVATKEQDAATYYVHQVIGFRARSGLPVIVSEPDLPDRYWYGNKPELLVDIRGAEAARLLPSVIAAVHSYPYPRSYTTWPGPNSNTFTAHVGREVPQLQLTLPVTAIGKDYLPGGALVAATPSGTGYQFSFFGLLSLSGAKDEGLELSVLGLGAGIDFRRPALKFPGIGRIGMKAAVTQSR